MREVFIAKQDAVSIIEKEMEHYVSDVWYKSATHSALNDVNEYIKALEPADVAQVRHGRWLPIVSYNNTYKCSECGRLLVDITDGLKMVAKHYPYCHCGAKMDAYGEE